MAHGAGRLRQDLQKPPIGTIARPGAVGAFPNGLTMDQFSWDVVMVRPFVDERTQLGRFVWVQRGREGRRSGLFDVRFGAAAAGRYERRADEG